MKSQIKKPPALWCKTAVVQDRTAYNMRVFNTRVVSEGIEITGVRGQLSESVVIPEYIGIHNVVSIGASAFANQNFITGISMPTTLLRIGVNAFENTTNLREVNFSDTFSMPNQALAFNSHWYVSTPTNFDMTAGITYTLSFDFTHLTATVSRNNVFASLGMGNHGFTRDLPVTQNFPNATSGRMVIEFTPTAEQLSYSTRLWVRFIRTSTRQSVSANINNITITPGSQLRTIGANAFIGSSITEISLPSTITYIGSDAFRGTSLTSINIPASVNRIRVNAFRDITTLTTVTFSPNSSINRIGNNAFRNTRITSLILPRPLTEIGDGTFADIPALGMLSIPNTVTTIGGTAFDASTRIYLEEGWQHIPNNFFTGAHARNIVIPNSVQTVGTAAFSLADNVRVYLAEGRTSI